MLPRVSEPPALRPCWVCCRALCHGVCPARGHRAARHRARAPRQVPLSAQLLTAGLAPCFLSDLQLDFPRFVLLEAERKGLAHTPCALRLRPPDKFLLTAASGVPTRRFRARSADVVKQWPRSDCWEMRTELAASLNTFTKCVRR